MPNANDNENNNDNGKNKNKNCKKGQKRNSSCIPTNINNDKNNNYHNKTEIIISTSNKPSKFHMTA